MNVSSSTIQQIQYILAPAVMISSCALIILGLQTKYSNLANRFRALIQEKRQLSSQEERGSMSTVRIFNIQQQVGVLFKRAKYIHDALLLCYSGIVCFIATSLLMFVDQFVPVSIHRLIIAVFITGLMLVLALAVCMIAEIHYFYNALKLERQE